MVDYPRSMDVFAEPLATLRRIQDEINRAFGDFRFVGTAEFPAVNVWRGEDAVLVTAEVPGVRLDDMELTVHQNTLTIKGRRQPEAQEPDVSFHRRERTYGSFARTIALPFNVDPERVKAASVNGVLIIDLPRPEAEKPKKIHISKA